MIRRRFFAALAVVLAGPVVGCTGLPPESRSEAPFDIGSVTAPPTVRSDWDISAEDMPVLLREQAKGAAVSLGLKPAEVPTEARLVRIVKLHEQPQLLVDCLEEFGFSARPLQGGLNFPEYPVEQQVPLRQAVYTCEVRYPIDPRYGMPLPVPQLARQYEHWVGEVKPCLMKNFNANVADPPTFEVWAAAYYANSGHWDPYDSLAHDGDQLDAAYAQCPRDAPGLYD